MEDKYVIESDISYEMKNRYPQYALSVIKSRALPDVRDGLKPVHRRILYAMELLGLTPEKGYRKCARIVGDVLGKYHPHGDTSVYDALVRMAQDFSMRYMLVDGHGNYGSIDGDGSAAMRYTEAKQSKISTEMVRNINKNTVDFMPNFDGEEQEPVVLPSRFPNLLVNGSSGIAVGMATNIPPHNLGEVIDGCIAYIDNKNIEIQELMYNIKSPDFPTGGIITNPQSLLAMYETGKGKIIVRGKYHIEHEDNKKQIVFTEIPYQVNKQKICLSISELCNKNEILKNVIDIRDESDREGMRIVIELKKVEDENKIISYLLQKTKLQNSFSAEFRALVNGVPEVLNLKEIIKHYINFQKEVITRRSEHDEKKTSDRLMIITGLNIAIDNIDETVKIIKESKNKTEAKDKIMLFLKINNKQADAILELKLYRLTSLDKDNFKNEFIELTSKLNELKLILSNESELKSVLKKELLEIKEKYDDGRKTKIIENDEIKTISIKKEDLTEDYLCTLIYTQENYFKKTRKYSLQQNIKDGDEVKTIVQCSNKDKAIFISNQGNAYFLNLWEVNEKTPSTIGDFLPNLLPLEKNETIIGMLTTNQYKGEVVLMYTDGHLVIIPLTSYATKQNATRLKNSLAKKLGLPILITQITEDVDIELTDSYGKTKIVNTTGLNRNDSRNSQGAKAWNSQKQGWSLISAKIAK